LLAFSFFVFIYFFNLFSFLRRNKIRTIAGTCVASSSLQTPFWFVSMSSCVSMSEYTVGRVILTPNTLLVSTALKPTLYTLQTYFIYP
jgi:hypothetical protein